MTQQEEKILKEKLNKEYEKVHGFVKRRVNRSDEAEDLVQEIFIMLL